MNSNRATGVDQPAAQLSIPALRVASIAARQAEMPLNDWIALAILGTAADQAGLSADAEHLAEPEAESVHGILSRLEAKLDKALAPSADKSKT